MHPKLRIFLFEWMKFIILKVEIILGVNNTYENIFKAISNCKIILIT